MSVTSSALGWVEVAAILMNEEDWHHKDAADKVAALAVSDAEMLAEVGADVVTCPASTIHGLFKHPLTDIGLDKFLADHAKLNK